MGAPTLRPIFSSLADDPEATGALDAFVIALAERVDALQDTQAGGNLGKLAEACEALAREAGSLGYPALDQVARAVASACARADAEDARKRLVDLTEISQRVRLGHRGAL